MTLNRNQLLDLAEQYSTPLYVYDGDKILDRYRGLYNFIPYPKLKIHFAMKANYNFEILKMLYAAGASLDTVSPAEVLLAMKAGFTKDRIIYTANNMTESDVEAVHDLGVLMNIGELTRLEKYGEKYPGSEVCIRFNPDVRDGEDIKLMTAGDMAKFGILLDQVEIVKTIVAKYNLKVIGLHEHTGSGLQNTESVFKSMKNLMAIATPENFPELRFLDFGGGFKVPYRPDEPSVDYAKMGAQITELFMDFCENYGRELEMYFEPGKYIVAESGYLLARVNTLKNNHGHLIAGTDSGFPQLIRPVLYNAYHHVQNLSNPNGPLKIYDIVGNICETGDYLAERRELPEIHEGDLLSVENAGAYCYSMGGVYNLRPMPAEVLIQNGKTRLARRRLSNQELIDNIIKESP
ncbi:MAG: diaminopimelate decarboxylase [Victivallaceae bacterium]|nr:diaminopimelate decarboxylase [Victivallaceae bacterium]MDD4181432.1 diaminopimelate decarboxylase [Victivallaceae bacterium]